MTETTVEQSPQKSAVETELVKASVSDKKPDNRAPLSIPVYKQDLKLASLQAQRVMNRSFTAAAGSLFRIDVILRIIGQEEHIDEVEDMIRSMIKELEDELNNEIARADEILKQNDIKRMPEYTHPRQFEIEIRSPQIANFARLVAALDTLMIRIDALWINGLVSNKQRARATHQWQQRLIGLAGRLIGYEKRARIAARQAGKESELETLAPESDQQEDELNLAAEEKELSSKS